MLGKLKANWIRLALNAVVLAVFLVHASGTGRIDFIEQMENLAYDSHLALTAPRTVDDSVVIVDIDENSLTAEGRWPWSRDKLAHLLEQLFDKYKVKLVGFDIVFAEPDESSGLKVLDRSGPDHIQRGTMWCYVGDDRDVLFEYAETGKGEDGPWAFLAGRKGYVQADAANVFDRVYNGGVAEAIEVGCMAHARRRLVELKDTDCRVAYPLLLIRRLYKLEELADLKELSPDARAAQRQERSLPALEKLQRWMVATVRDEPPSSAVAQAASYFVNHWAALTRFVEDGRLSLDNNLCERQIRDLALGRRNYLFAGSHDAARRSARLYSLMRTCAQHGVAPLPYLTDVIEKLAADWPEQRMAELLPDRWASLQAHASAAAHV